MIRVTGKEKAVSRQALSRHSERALRRELPGVGIAFGMTTGAVNWIAGGDFVLAAMVGLGGGVVYSLGWRVVQRSPNRRKRSERQDG